MRKSTNLICAILGATTLAAAPSFAADIATNTVPLKVATQYFGVAPAGNTDTNDIIVTLGAEYNEDDVVILSFSNADDFDLNALQSFIQVLPDGGNAKKGLTFGLQAAEEQDGRMQVYYRVTSITRTNPTDLTTGVNVNFSNVTYKSLRTDSPIDVNFSARSNSGLPLDTFGGDSRSQTLIEPIDQFSITVTTAFDEEVDFENDRKKFLGGATSDTLVFALTSDATLDKAVEVDRVRYEIEGDFSWVIDQSPNTRGIQSATDLFVLDDLSGTAGCTSVNVESGLLSFSCQSFDQLTLTIETAQQGSTEVIPTTEFQLTAEIDYSVPSGSSASQDLGPTSAGAWTLNASQTLIPYMPYSRQDLNQYSQIIYANNIGDQSSEVSVDVYTDSGRRISLSNDDLMGLKATRGITQLTGAIRDAIEAKGLLLGGSEVKEFALNVVVYDLNKNVQIFSSYNDSSSDRGFVQNDSMVILEVKTGNL